MVGRYVPSAYVKAGPKSFKDQMSREEQDKYQEKLDWIRAQKAAGHLPRGWQSIAADRADYTLVTVSEVLTGKRWSPPCLDKVYMVALDIVGANAPQDKADRVKLQQEIVDTLSKQVDEVDAELAKAEEDYDQLVRQLAADHLTQVDKLRRKRDEAERHFGQAQGRLERYQLEYDLEGEELG